MSLGKCSPPWSIGATNHCTAWLPSVHLSCCPRLFHLRLLKPHGERPPKRMENQECFGVVKSQGFNEPQKACLHQKSTYWCIIGGKIVSSGRAAPRAASISYSFGVLASLEEREIFVYIYIYTHTLMSLARRHIHILLTHPHNMILSYVFIK